MCRLRLSCQWRQSGGKFRPGCGIKRRVARGVQVRQREGSVRGTDQDRPPAPSGDWSVPRTRLPNPFTFKIGMGRQITKPAAHGDRAKLIMADFHLIGNTGGGELLRQFYGRLPGGAERFAQSGEIGVSGGLVRIVFILHEGFA